ncbi:MAG TPA: hypothetical protein VL688_07800, partial [Verrucomicrobiae bacterium]|nr:hypothetical protein [Verrucomicrobiae bacterium]
NSIAEKKITRANHATRYIDALVQALRKDYEKNSPLYEENISEEEIRARLQEELDSFISAYFDRARQAALQKTRIFLDGVKQMWMEKNVSREAVQRAFDQARTATLSTPLALIPENAAQAPVPATAPLAQSEIEEKARALQKLPVARTELLETLAAYEVILRTQEQIFAGPVAELVRGAIQSVPRTEDAIAILELARQGLEKEAAGPAEKSAAAQSQADAFSPDMAQAQLLDVIRASREGNSGTLGQAVSELLAEQKRWQEAAGEEGSLDRASNVAVIFREVGDSLASGRLQLSSSLASDLEALSLSCSVCAVELARAPDAKAHQAARAVEEVLDRIDRFRSPAETEAALAAHTPDIGRAVRGNEAAFRNEDPIPVLFRQTVSAAAELAGHRRAQAFPLVSTADPSLEEASALGDLNFSGAVISAEHGTLILHAAALGKLAGAQALEQLARELAPVFDALGINAPEKQQTLARIVRAELRRLQSLGMPQTDLRFQIVRNMRNPADYDFDAGAVRYHESLFTSDLSPEAVAALLDLFSGHEIEHHRLTSLGVPGGEQESQVVLNDLKRFASMRAARRVQLLDALRQFGSAAGFFVEQAGREALYFSLLKASHEAIPAKTPALTPQDQRPPPAAAAPAVETAPVSFEGTLNERFGAMLRRLAQLERENQILSRGIFGRLINRRQLRANDAEIKRLREGDFDAGFKGLADLAVEAYETRDAAALKEFVARAFETPESLESDGAALQALMAALANQSLDEAGRREFNADVRARIAAFRSSQPEAARKASDGLFGLEAAMLLNEGRFAAWFEGIARGTNPAPDPSPLWDEVLKAYGHSLQASEILILQSLLFNYYVFYRALAEQAEGYNSPLRQNGDMRTAIGIRDIQKIGAKVMLSGRIALAATSAGKNIVAFLRGGIETIRAEQYGTRTGRAQSVGVVIAAETGAKAFDFVHGSAPIPVKGRDGRYFKDKNGQNLKLFVPNQFLAKLFGARGGLVSLQESMENNDEKGTAEALQNSSAIKVIGYDQIGFSEISLNPTNLDLFKGTLDSWGIEEIDKFGSEKTQFIMSDTENAKVNAPEFIAAIRRLYADMGLAFDAEGKSGRVKFVETAEEADEAWNEANKGEQERVIVWGGKDSRSRRAALSTPLKTKLIREGHDPRHIYQALQTALVLEFGRDFDGTQGELTPLDNGQPQKTNFSGKVTKVFLSLMVGEIKQAKIAELEEALKKMPEGEAARLARREIQALESGKIDETKLENSLTQSTNTKFGVFKAARLLFMKQAVAVEEAALRKAGPESPVVVTLRPLAGSEAGVLDVGLYSDGNFLYVTGRNGTDKIPLAEISNDRDNPTNPAKNRYAAVSRTVDKDGAAVYHVHKDITLSGSTATFNPVLLYQLGLETVLSDRSGMKRGDQKDAKGNVISQGWQFLETLADPAKAREIVEGHIRDSHEEGMNERARPARNTKSFTQAEDTAAVQASIALGSVAAQDTQGRPKTQVSSLIFQPNHAKFERIRKTLMENSAGVAFQEVRIGQFVNRVISRFEKMEKELRDMKKEAARTRDPAFLPRIEELQGQLKLKEQAVREAVEIEKAWLEGKDVAARTVAGLQSELETLQNGKSYLYLIDSGSYNELISTVAQTANSRGAPAVVLTSNITGTQQGVDFEGEWTESVDSVELGNRQLMQIVGRIVRNEGALGHRYLVMQAHDYKRKQDEIIGPKNSQRRAELRRALVRVAADMARLLDQQVDSGDINATKYFDETGDNEFQDAIAVLDRLDRDEDLKELDWLMLLTAYNYIRDDISGAVSHSLGENHQGLGHRFYRGLVQRAEAAAVQKAKAKYEKKIEELLAKAKAEKKPLMRAKLENMIAALKDKMEKEVAGDAEFTAIRDAYHDLQNREQALKDVRLDGPRAGELTGSEKIRQDQLRELNLLEESLQGLYAKLGGRIEDVIGSEIPETLSGSPDAAALVVAEYLRDVKEARQIIETGISRRARKFADAVQDVARELGTPDLAAPDALEQIEAALGRAAASLKPQESGAREENIARAEAVYLGLARLLRPGAAAQEALRREASGEILDEAQQAEKQAWQDLLKRAGEHPGIQQQLRNLDEACPNCAASFTPNVLKAMSDLGLRVEAAAQQKDPSLLTANTHAETAEFALGLMDMVIATQGEGGAQAQVLRRESRYATPEALVASIEQANAAPATLPEPEKDQEGPAPSDTGHGATQAGVLGLSAQTPAEPFFQEEEAPEDEICFDKDCRRHGLGGYIMRTDGQWQWTKEGTALAKALEQLRALGAEERAALSRQLSVRMPAAWEDDASLLNAALALREAGLLDFVNYDRLGILELRDAAVIFEAAGAAPRSLDARVLYAIYGDGRSELSARSRLAEKALELLKAQGREAPAALRRHLEKLAAGRPALLRAQGQLKQADLREASATAAGLTGEAAERQEKALKKERDAAEKKQEHALRDLRQAGRSAPLEKILADRPPQGADAAAHRRTALLAALDLADAPQDDELYRLHLNQLLGHYDEKQLARLGLEGAELLARLEKNIAALIAQGVSEADARKLYLARAEAGRPEPFWKRGIEWVLAKLGNDGEIWKQLLAEANHLSQPGLSHLVDRQLAALMRQRESGSPEFEKNARLLRGRLEALRVAGEYEAARRNRVNHSLAEVENRKKEAAALRQPSPYRYPTQKKEDDAINRLLKRARGLGLAAHFSGDEAAPLGKFDAGNLDHIAVVQKNLYLEIASAAGMEGVEPGPGREAAAALRAMDAHLHAAAAGDLKGLNQYVENQIKRTGKSREQVEREYLDRYVTAEELFSLEEALDIAQREGLSLDKLARLLKIYVPRLAVIPDAALAFFLESLGGDPVLRRTELKQLAESAMKAASVRQFAASALDLGAAQDLVSAFRRFGLSNLEKILLVSLSGLAPTAELARQAGQLELLLPLTQAYGVTGLERTEEALSFLAGKSALDFGQATGLAFEGMNFAAPLGRPEIERLYTQALKSEMRLTGIDFDALAPESFAQIRAAAVTEKTRRLTEGLALVSVHRAQEHLDEDNGVRTSFKGLAWRSLGRAAQLSGSAATRGLKLQAHYRVNDRRDRAPLRGVTLPGLLQRLQASAGSSALWYQDKVRRLSGSEGRQIEFARKLNDGTNAERKAAKLYAVEGWNIYQRKAGSAEIDAAELGDVRAEVLPASRDPYLGRLVREFGFPDIPLLTFVLDQKSVDYLRRIGFFSETGQANATRPEETPADAAAQPFGVEGENGRHLFADTGYFIRQQGYKEEAIEHETTHLLDLGQILRAGEGLPKRMRDLHKVLLEENEAYLVQVLLNKVQQNGRLYDHDSTENGPLFSYAMDIFRKWENDIKADVWRKLYVQAAFQTQDLSPEQEEQADKAAAEYLKRLKNPDLAPPAGRGPDLKELDRRAEKEARPQIEAAGIEALKEKTLLQMRQMRNAMRVLSRALTPAQVLFVARMAKRIEDLTDYLGLEEDDLRALGQSLEPVRLQFQADVGIPAAGKTSRYDAFEEETRSYVRQLERDPRHDADGRELHGFVQRLEQIAPGASPLEVAYKKRSFQPVFDKIIEAALKPAPPSTGAGKPPVPEEEEFERRLDLVARYLKTADREVAILAMIALFEAGRENPRVHEYNLKHLGLAEKAKLGDVLADSLKLHEALSGLLGEALQDRRYLREAIRRLPDEGQQRLGQILTEAQGSKALHTLLGPNGRYVVELEQKPTAEELQQMEKLPYEFNLTVFADRATGLPRYMVTIGVYNQHVETYGRDNLDSFYHIHPTRELSPEEQAYLKNKLRDPGALKREIERGGFSVIPSGLVGDRVRDYDGAYQLKPGGYGHIATGLGVTRYQLIAREDPRYQTRDALRGSLKQIAWEGHWAARDGKAFTAIAEEGGVILLIEFQPRGGNAAQFIRFTPDAVPAVRPAVPPAPETRNELREAPENYHKRTVFADDAAQLAAREVGSAVADAFLGDLGLAPRKPAPEAAKLADSLNVLYERGIDAEEAADALRSVILDQVEAALAARRQAFHDEGVSAQILETAVNLIQGRDLHLLSSGEVREAFLEAARLISDMPTAGYKVSEWAQSIRHLILLTPKSAGATGQEGLTDEKVRAARALADSIKNISGRAIVEYRLSRRLQDARDRWALAAELLESVRNAVALNPNLQVRLVASSRTEERRLRRALGRITRKYHQELVSAGRIVIVNASALPQFDTAPNLVIADDAGTLPQVSGRRGFDSLNYADGNLVYYAGAEKVTPSEIFLAAAASLSKDTLQALVAYDNGLVRVRSQGALSPFAVVAQIMEQEVREKLAVQSAA